MANISASKSVNVYATNSPTQYPYTFTTSFVENSSSIANNTSNITAKGTMYGKNINFGSYNVKLSLYWYDNKNNSSGKLLVEKTYTSTEIGETYTIEKTFDVPHNDDGSLKGYTKLVVDGGSGWQPPDTNLQTANTSLTTIARATNCPSQTCYVGKVNEIKLSPASSAFTHIAIFSIGTQDYNISGTDSIILDLTDKIIYDLFEEANYESSVTLQTYNGSSLVGSKTGKFIIQCDVNLCKPSLTAIYQDTNELTLELTNNNQKIVKNKSILEILITALSDYSVIDYVTVDGIKIEDCTKYINQKPIKNTYELKAYDQRGFSSDSFTITIDLIDYIELTCSAEFFRVAPTTGEVGVKINGNYYNDNIGETFNELTITYQYKESDNSSWSEEIEIIPDIIENTYSKEVSLGTIFNYKKRYDFKLNVLDKLSSLTPQRSIQKGEPMYWSNDDYFKFNNTPLFEDGNEFVNYTIVDTW